MKKFLRYILMLVLVLAAASALLVHKRNAAFPRQPGPGFDDEVSHVIRETIDQQQPELVLLGDSIVELNIDPSLLEQELGKVIYPININASSTTMWYLVIKNNILLASHRPQYLVLIFRDSVMTNPAYRAHGQHPEVMDTFASSQDRLAAQRAYVDRMNPLERLGEMYFPLYSQRSLLRGTVDYYIRYPAVYALLDCGKRCMDVALTNILSGGEWDPDLLNGHIAGVEDELYTRSALDFYGRVNDSFLPDIIRMCRENGIQLILVHAKTLRYYRNTYEPALLRQYLLDMEDYLKENGVPYLDLATDPRIRSEDFSDTLHIFPGGVERYTLALSDLLKTVLP